MKTTITEEVSKTISKEILLQVEEKKIKDFEILLKEMKSAGLIKTPTYTLPMVDTIGKTYYSLLNQHE